MKQIRLPQAFADMVALTAPYSAAVVVEVDWFPPLTDDQTYANAAALVEGRPIPYPNPNFIEVLCPRAERHDRDQ